jgi:hypothetical protein
VGSLNASHDAQGGPKILLVWPAECPALRRQHDAPKPDGFSHKLLDRRTLDQALGVGRNPGLEILRSHRPHRGLSAAARLSCIASTLRRNSTSKTLDGRSGARNSDRFLTGSQDGQRLATGDPAGFGCISGETAPRCRSGEIMGPRLFVGVFARRGVQKRAPTELGTSPRLRFSDRASCGSALTQPIAFSCTDAPTDRC